jgi:hypothetical protein
MKVLSSKIDEIGHFASNVASAMEEQSYPTADISQNIESACPYRKSNPLAVDRESGDAAARCLICAN